MTAGEPDLSIVVPVFNERENLEPLVDGLKDAMGKWKYATEVVMVNDGSSDDSWELMQKLAAREGFLRTVRHDRNRGFGAALKTGYGNARGKVIATMDADLTQDPGQIASFMEKIGQGADIVVGSRYVQGGEMIDVAAHRRMVSAIGRLVVTVLFRLPIKDVTNGFRAIRKSVVDGLQLKSDSFNILPEMIVKAHRKGCSITEVPMTLTKRKFGVSKMNPLKDYLLEISTLLKLRFGWLK